MASLFDNIGQQCENNNKNILYLCSAYISENLLLFRLPHNKTLNLFKNKPNMCRSISYPKVKSYHPGSMGGPSLVSTHPSECCLKISPFNFSKWYPKRMKSYFLGKITLNPQSSLHSSFFVVVILIYLLMNNFLFFFFILELGWKTK